MTIKPAPQHGGAIQVLHIEDYSGVARSMARGLRLQGYGHQCCFRRRSHPAGQEGLIPDLILTDHHLPLGMTGSQVITEIETRLGFKPPTIMPASLPEPADLDVVLREIGRLLSTRVQ